MIWLIIPRIALIVGSRMKRSEEENALIVGSRMKRSEKENDLSSDLYSIQSTRNLNEGQLACLAKEAWFFEKRWWRDIDIYIIYIATPTAQPGTDEPCKSSRPTSKPARNGPSLKFR